MTVNGSVTYVVSSPVAHYGWTKRLTPEGYYAGEARWARSSEVHPAWRERGHTAVRPAQLAHSWTNSWHTAGIQLAYIWHTADIQLATSSVQLAYSWHTAGIQRAHSWHTWRERGRTR
jgi:hypothetical protein